MKRGIYYAIGKQSCLQIKKFAYVQTYLKFNLRG